MPLVFHVFIAVTVMVYLVAVMVCADRVINNNAIIPYVNNAVVSEHVIMRLFSCIGRNNKMA